VAAALHAFPRAARVRRVRLLLEPWTIESGLLTPTLKLERPQLESRFARDIAELFAGHDLPG
jgi:long-chain acyl-CoA synthetase